MFAGKAMLKNIDEAEGDPRQRDLAMAKLWTTAKIEMQEDQDEACQGGKLREGPLWPVGR